jgi:multiple sugar transport system ATP-binding protein
VQEAARVLGLEAFLKRKPRALSGGQRQRVAMGRAIVREPQAFLMDEPLSNLDAKLRVQMRAEISQLQSDLGTTTIYVTHDQVEAMTMGDRIAVMRKGELQQVGRPQDLYDKPVNLFVGGFIGSPAMNMLEGTLARSDGGLAVEIGDQRLALGDEALSERPGLETYEGRPIVLGIRPEHVEDAALVPDAPAERRLRGTVELTEALGSEIVAHVSIDAKPALTEDVRELARDIGEDLQEEAEATATLVGRVGARSSLRQGDPAELAVDTSALHFFDLETGAGVYDDGPKGASG